MWGAWVETHHLEGTCSEGPGGHQVGPAGLRGTVLDPGARMRAPGGHLPCDHPAGPIVGVTRPGGERMVRLGRKRHRLLRSCGRIPGERVMARRGRATLAFRHRLRYHLALQWAPRKILDMDDP